MRLWFDFWRFELYLGLHWYDYDQPWYKKTPKLFEIRNFDQSSDVTFQILFMCVRLNYRKRWNGSENDPRWFWI